uniref:Uncharacterized protein n=1 Tax=Plectus sambesii TaxID=2011161 RepID=A0A914X1P6_9BILA
MDISAQWTFQLAFSILLSDEHGRAVVIGSKNAVSAIRHSTAPQLLVESMLELGQADQLKPIDDVVVMEPVLAPIRDFVMLSAKDLLSELSDLLQQVRGPGLAYHEFAKIGDAIQFIIKNIYAYNGYRVDGTQMGEAPEPVEIVPTAEEVVMTADDAPANINKNDENDANDNNANDDARDDGNWRTNEEGTISGDDGRDGQEDEDDHLLLNVLATQPSVLPTRSLSSPPAKRPRLLTTTGMADTTNHMTAEAPLSEAVTASADRSAMRLKNLLEISAIRTRQMLEGDAVNLLMEMVAMVNSDIDGLQRLDCFPRRITHVAAIEPA